MPELTEKKRINVTAKARIEAIYDRYHRTPTVNELRAIDELPLDTINNLNDRSEVGKRIWRILEKSERTRDISLLEQAGLLLWEQVTSRPEPYSMTKSSSYSRGDPKDRQDLAQGFSSTKFSSHGTTTLAYRGGLQHDGGLKSDKSDHKSGNRSSGEREGRVVGYKKSVEGGAREYSHWDSKAMVPLTKRAN